MGRVYDSETEWHWERDEPATYEAQQPDGMTATTIVNCEECGKKMEVDLACYYESETYLCADCAGIVPMEQD